MTDDFDRLLRSELQSAARDFEPGHPDGSVGSALSARLRRRRQRRNVAGTVAVFAVLAGTALFVKLATPPTQTLAATGQTPPVSSVSVATPDNRQAGFDHPGGNGCATSCLHSSHSQGSSAPGGRNGGIGTKATTPGAYNTGGGPSVPTSPHLCVHPARLQPDGRSVRWRHRRSSALWLRRHDVDDPHVERT